MDEKFDVEKVKEWLNQQWQGPKLCPVCKSNRWAIGERPIEVREFHGGGLVVGGPVYPLVTLTCGVCGYTLLFNAIVAGLVEGKQKETASTADNEESEEEERRRRL